MAPVVQFRNGFLYWIHDFDNVNFFFKIFQTKWLVMHISFYYGENDYHLDTFVILTDQTCAVSITIFLKTLLTSKPRWKAME